MSNLITPLFYDKPFYDESPISYLMRVKKENSYKFVRWLFTTEAPNFSYALQSLYDILISEPWTGYSEIKTIVEPTCTANKKFLLSSIYRYCPDCIRDSPYHRVHWHLVTSTVCLKHRRWLVDTCPACNHTLTFDSLRSFGECSCGASLIEINNHHIVPDPVFRLHRYLNDIPQDDEQFEFRKVFDGSEFKLEERVNLIYELIQWHSPDRHLRGVGSFYGLKKISDAYHYITRFSDSWFRSKESFLLHLNHIHKHLVLDQEEGDRLFQNYYRAVFTICQKPIFEPVLMLLQEYIQYHWEHAINKRNSLFSKELISRHKWLALKVAEKEYQITRSALLRGIDSRDIRSRTTSNESKELVVVHRDDIVAFMKHEETQINLLGAASLLGVTKSQLNSLLFSGALGSDYNLENRNRKIKISDIKMFTDWFNSNLCTVQTHYLTLAEAIRKVGNGIKEPFLAIIFAILDEELESFIDSRFVGLRRLRIKETSLKSWYKKQIGFKDDNAFSIQSLRSYFKVSSLLIPQLIEKGIIKRMDYQIGQNIKTIPFKEVQQFKDRYALLSKISRISELSSPALMIIIEQYDVFPIDHKWKKSDQFVQKIYYRHELLKVKELQSFIATMEDWEHGL